MISSTRFVPTNARVAAILQRLIAVTWIAMLVAVALS